jgi:hypothetical protein
MIKIDIRMRHLEDNICQDLKLLKEYENIMRIESDPRNLARYNLEIIKQKEALNRYQTEYEELEKQVRRLTPEKINGIDRQLQEMNAILESIQNEQMNVLKDQDALRRCILDRFDVMEQKVVNSMVNKLDQSLLIEVARALDGLESINSSERIFTDISDLLNKVLDEIKNSEYKYNTQLADQTNQLLSAINKPELTMEQKLKISVPIVPFILSYECIAGMSDGIELKTLWNRLKDMVRQDK